VFVEQVEHCFRSAGVEVRVRPAQQPELGVELRLSRRAARTQALTLDGEPGRRGLLPPMAAPLGYDKPLCASLDGFTLHAATRAGALHLAGARRCCARPSRPSQAAAASAKLGEPTDVPGRSPSRGPANPSFRSGLVST
jgi:hypothetical protein